MALKLSPTRTVIRGDSDKFRITFAKQISSTKNSGHGGCSCLTGLDKSKTNKQPIDITGWSIRFTVRPNVPDSSVMDDIDALISEEAILADPVNGVAIIYVKPETTLSLEPGDYLYDIQVTRPKDEYGFQEESSITRNQDITLDEEDNESTNNADDGYTI